MNYYNEHDAKKAAWLRELIKAGVISPGEVDERSIVDVRASDLVGFRQCHFFAGIGVWSYALRLAGVADEREVWTASCPCPSFSVAGKGAGFDDPRHLWPDVARLARECRPHLIFGEQVSAAIGYGWFDLVQHDLEAEDYAVGKIVFPACSVGAPHIRQRLYWVAVAAETRCSGREDATVERTGDAGALEHAEGDGREQWRTESGGRGFERGRGLGALANRDRERRDWQRVPSGSRREQMPEAVWSGGPGELADTDGRDASAEREQRSGEQRLQPNGRGPVNGFWTNAEWIACTDGKARPVEPGSSPLAHGATARVLRLRGYGDGIVAPQAAEFIRAVLEEIGG